MADENTGAEQADAAEATESETSTEDTSNDGAGADSGDADADGSQDTQSSDEEEPPVRKSAKDFIIERKDKKIAKLKEGQGTEATAAGSDQPDIRSVIREELAPITSTFAKSADETELQAAFTKYPEAKKIEKTIRRYMDSDAYARVPVEFIVRGLLGVKEAAKKQADDAARATRQGGHPRRPTDTKAKTAWDLSDAEFEKEVAKLMSTGRQ